MAECSGVDDMAGIFGIVAKDNCVQDACRAVPSHAHLGRWQAGIAFLQDAGILNTEVWRDGALLDRSTRAPVDNIHSKMAVGSTSDEEYQPFVVESPHGHIAIATAGMIGNAEALKCGVLGKRLHFFTTSRQGGVNDPELVSVLLSQESDIGEGIRAVQEAIEGSCSFLILTRDGIVCARDLLGHTALVIGKKENTWIVTVESATIDALGFELVRFMGPGEVMRLSTDGIEQLLPPIDRIKVCSLLWLSLGLRASSYEGIPVSQVRQECGRAAARREDAECDFVTGVPGAGSDYAVAYATEAGVPYKPVVEAAPVSEAREFRSGSSLDKLRSSKSASDQWTVVGSEIDNSRIIVVDDIGADRNILGAIADELRRAGAAEVHIRLACPLLVRPCPFFRLPRLSSEEGLLVERIGEGLANADAPEAYSRMQEVVRDAVGADSLKCLPGKDVIESIGLPVEKICTSCWEHPGCYDPMYQPKESRRRRAGRPPGRRSSTSPTARRNSTQRITRGQRTAADSDTGDKLFGSRTTPRVFLSHSHQDQRFVRSLGSRLKENGVKVWIDEGEILHGESLIEKLAAAIDRVDLVLAVISPASVESEWVKKELAIAMTQEIKKRRVKVIPILRRDCQPPPFLEDKLYADFTSSYRQQKSFPHLVRSIKTYCSRRKR